MTDAQILHFSAAAGLCVALLYRDQRLRAVPIGMGGAFLAAATLVFIRSIS